MSDKQPSALELAEALREGARFWHPLPPGLMAETEEAAALLISQAERIAELERIAADWQATAERISESRQERIAALEAEVERLRAELPKELKP